MLPQARLDNFPFSFHVNETTGNHRKSCKSIQWMNICSEWTFFPQIFALCSLISLSQGCQLFSYHLQLFCCSSPLFSLHPQLHFLFSTFSSFLPTDHQPSQILSGLECHGDFTSLSQIWIKSANRLKSCRGGLSNNFISLIFLGHQARR